MNVIVSEGVGSARQEAISLWRAGRYNEARILLTDALRAEVNTEEKISLAINLAQVERAAGRAAESLAVLLEIAPLAEQYYSPLLRGKFYNTLGAAHYALGNTDPAFEAYTAASVYYERAKEFRRRADVENNLALLMIDTARYGEAHSHLDLALVGCNDEIVHAQIDETRARTFLAEGRVREALDSALASVLALKETSEGRLLCESLETLSRVTERLKREDERSEIAKALAAAGGRVKQASELLGLSHQTLAWKLEHHHRELLALRAPKKKPRGRYAAK